MRRRRIHPAVWLAGAVGLAALCGLALFAVVASLGPAAGRGGVAVGYPVGLGGSNAWTFRCEVTGRGGATCDEAFAAPYWERIEAQGGRLDRAFGGRRVTAVLAVESGGGGVRPGTRCRVWGTVAGVAGRTVTLTDCAFAPE